MRPSWPAKPPQTTKDRLSDAEQALVFALERIGEGSDPELDSLIREANLAIAQIAVPRG